MVAEKSTLFQYWYLGRQDALDGLPALRWMKNSWPEDCRDAYYRGHESVTGINLVTPEPESVDALFDRVLG